MEKVDNIHEQLDDVSRERETKESKEKGRNQKTL